MLISPFLNISQPNLQKFQHKTLARPQDALHPWNKHVYGKHIKLDNQKCSTSKLNSADTNCVQYIISTLLYHARAVDPTTIPALNEISTY